MSSSGNPIRNGQNVNDLLTAILLPSEIAVIKIEAHTKSTGPEYQGNTLADFHGKAAATVSITISAGMALILLLQKMTPLLSDFCHLDVLATVQKSDSESNELRWVNNGDTLNEQLELWETQDNHLVLPAPL